MEDRLAPTQPVGGPELPPLNVRAHAQCATHGKPRTNLDKRRAVNVLLSDEEWSQKSDRWIAEKACVTHPFVTRLRGEATGGNGYHLPPAAPGPKKGKDGKSYSFPDRKPKSNPPAPPKPEPKQAALPGPVAEAKAEAKAGT